MTGFDRAAVISALAERRLRICANLQRFDEARAEFTRRVEALGCLLDELAPRRSVPRA